MCHEIEGIDILLTGHQHGNRSHRNKWCNNFTDRMQWTIHWKITVTFENRTKWVKRELFTIIARARNCGGPTYSFLSCRL